MHRSLMTAAAALALAVPAVRADDADGMTIGDAAPPIDIAHWVKGDTVASFEEGKVYVLEFWATWCAPCVASMPHLSKLQEQYKDYDVTVIGVSDEPLQTVVGFLFKENRGDGAIQNDRIGYTLTTDPDKSVKKDYFDAAGQRGIPCSFIVGKSGRVEWIGHPMGMDKPLDAVVRDEWDRDAFKAEWEENRAAEKVYQGHAMALRDATQAENWEAAIGALDNIIALGPQYQGYRVQKFMILAQQLDAYDRAYAFADETVTESWDNAAMLNQLAWFIVDEPGLERRDLDLAMKAARRANELTGGTEGAILDTVARVYYEKGDLDTAIVYQRKAVKHAEGPMLDDLQNTLEKYELEANER